jgi:putative ABC transport system permease protein
VAHRPRARGRLSQKPVGFSTNELPTQHLFAPGSVLAVMSLNIRPIISALLRNWAGPVLVAAQVAIALAVVANAVYIVKQRIDKIDRPTGMDVQDIFVIRSDGVTDNYAHEATIRADLAYLRGQPAVVAVTTMDYAPLSGDGNSIGVMLQPDDQRHAVGTGYYEVDEDGIRALGVHLTAGRSFTHNEILPPRTGDASGTSAGQAIVTQALADDLYPDGHALGKTLYDSGRHFTSPAIIVGIIDHMYGFRVSWGRVDRVILAPRLPYPDDQPIANYVVRTQPGRRDVVMRSVESYLQASNPDRIIEWIRPLDYFKDRSYVADRSMEIFLSVITLMLLVVTAVGIFGLVTFNVGARAKQIGTRRALGAQRLDIVSYFLVENWLITTAGMAVGCALALWVGFWLSVHYQLPRLDLYYLVGGIPALWMVGLVAAWYPAQRAAAVPPAVATRTV